MRIQNIKVYNAYKHTIENTAFLEEGITRKKKMRVLAYNIFGILFIPWKYSNFTSLTLHVINGKSEFRSRNFKGIPELYYGLTFSNWKELKGQNSHISYISRSERIKVLLTSLFSYSNVNSCGGCYTYWLDFCIWNTYVSKLKRSIIVSNGHYDRLTTELSELCELYSVEYNMKQHGLISNNIKIPHKIHCDKVYAYDNYQAELFRKCIIENDDCLYEIWYKPGFDFVSKKFERFTVGVIENKSVENQITEIYDILKSLSEYGTEKQDVVIMLHPLSEQSEYEDLVKNCRCNVEFTRKKYFDFDMIVSTPSTLAYDYVRAGYTGPIIFAEFISKTKDCLANYNNIIHVGSPDELDRKIAEVLKV